MVKTIQKIIKKAWKLTDLAMPYFMLIMVLILSMPHLTLASNLDIPSAPILPYLAGKQEYLKTFNSGVARLPQNEQKTQARLTYKIWLTAYNSHPNQTDNTPCITASGLNVCERNAEDIIATNFLRLPFGTKVRFPEIYGDKIFLVEDRMNSRYNKHADIWLKDYETARLFGRKLTTIEIF